MNSLRDKIRKIISEALEDVDNLNAAKFYNQKNDVDLEAPVYYHGTTKTRADNIKKNGFYPQHYVNITTDQDEAEEYANICAEDDEDQPYVLKVRLKKGAKSKNDNSNGLDSMSYKPKYVVLDYSETIPLINTTNIMEEGSVGKIVADFSSEKIFVYGKEAGNFEVYTSKDGKYLNLDKIFINKGFRGQGVGQEAMNKILEYASKNNLITTVTPDSVWGSSVQKLIKWYKSLGFIMNKGKNKDFGHQYLMYKLP